jgi:hypothetical protein
VHVPILIAIVRFWEYQNLPISLIFKKISVISFASLAAIVILPSKTNTSLEIQQVMRKGLQVADINDVINCQSWGCYSPYSLLNTNNIPVVFAVDSIEIQELQAKMMGKGKILHVCMDCNLQDLSILYKDSEVQLLDTKTKFWRIFLVRN